MTGLEKIVEQIKQEAQATADEQIAQSKKEAEQILADAKKKLESSYIAAMEQADAHAKQILLRGESAASLQERKMLLEAKQQIIQQIFDEAIDTMQKLPIKEYFELLLRMVDRYALEENGTIHLSQQDLDRIPEFFMDELKKRQITISKESARLNGGFLLSYGDIEQNCSFEALLSANREDLQDQIVTLIFYHTVPQSVEW